MKRLLLLLFLPLFAQAQTNVDLPASTATTGQIRIGGKTVLQTYGVNNYFAAGAGNYVMQQQGTYNVAIGLEAMQKNLIGDYCTALGHYAGKMNRYGQGNIFIGYNAGNNSFFADLSNRFIVDNTTTSTPFLYGNMTPGVRDLTVNAGFTVTGSQIYFSSIPDTIFPYGLYFDTSNARVYYGPVVDPSDTCLHYLDGDTVINKNFYKVKFTDSVYFERDAIPFLETGDPLPGFLTLRKFKGTTTRQLVMSPLNEAADSLVPFIDHGQLQGLTDDDHLQYVALDGRPGDTISIISPDENDSVLIYAKNSPDYSLVIEGSSINIKSDLLHIDNELVSESFATDVSLVSTNSGLADYQHTILVDNGSEAGAGRITITLPQATSCPGREYILKLWDEGTGGNGFTLDGDGTERIYITESVSAESYNFDVEGGTITVVSYDGKWIITNVLTSHSW